MPLKCITPELVLVALAGSNLVEQARAAGLKVVSEALQTELITAMVHWFLGV